MCITTYNQILLMWVYNHVSFDQCSLYVYMNLWPCMVETLALLHKDGKIKLCPWVAVASILWLLTRAVYCPVQSSCCWALHRALHASLILADLVVYPMTCIWLCSRSVIEEQRNLFNCLLIVLLRTLMHTHYPSLISYVCVLCSRSCTST